jgi:hypothetical protein
MQSDDQSVYLELEAGIVSEIVPHEKSKYFLHSDGFARIQNFDTKRMVDDFSREFPSVPVEEIKRLVAQAIYNHFLR